MTGDPHKPCRLPRRLLAISYDAMLLVSLYIFATIPILALTRGEAVPSGNVPYMIYLLLLGYLYFAWQWMRGGQTLGMRAWRVRLISDDGALHWGHVSKRFVLAVISLSMLGLGFAWAAFDREGLAFHDRCSRTRLIVL